MASMGHMFILMASLALSVRSSPFVPTCMVEQCGSEMLALGRDNYTSAFVTCAKDNFGPCGKKAWDCLGDETCRMAATCAPRVFQTCKADIWKMLTDDKEREIIMCIEKCPLGKDGKPSPICVAAKCGEAAVKCLVDETCRHVLNCVPKAMMACSASAFHCIFGSAGGVCRDNAKCLGSGLSQCSAPGVNFLTDTKIADFVECAGSKCPHPVRDIAVVGTQAVSSQSGLDITSSSAPIDAIKQMICIEAKCPLKVPKILLDQDSKDLFTCIGKTDFAPVWDCLGDKSCKQSLSCWTKPMDSCTSDIWQVLTDNVERQRIETGVTCLRSCQQQNPNNFIDAALCSLDRCSQGLMDCYNDVKCKSAVKCFPSAVSECLMPTLENYLNDAKFQKATKAIAKGMEVCGRAAVEMLRDQNVAEAVRCAAQCTHMPSQNSNAFVVV